MPLSKQKELTREDVLNITALSRTLLETAGELQKLLTRRHPDLDQAVWMISLAIKKCQSSLSNLLLNP